MKKYVVYKAYSDGACNKKGNGGAGIFIYKDTEILNFTTLKQNETTNNQMELAAAIYSLIEFSSITKNDSAKLILYTDSQYVQKGITEWIHNWKQNNWKNSAGKKVANRELWIIFDSLREEIEGNGHKLELEWVRGHNNNIGNEVADRLATFADFSSGYMEEKELYSAQRKTLQDIERLFNDALEDDELANINFDKEEISVIYNDEGVSASEFINDLRLILL